MGDAMRFHQWSLCAKNLRGGVRRGITGAVFGVGLMLGIAFPATAQTVLSNTIEKSRSGNSNIRSSFTAPLGTYTATNPATITQITIQIDANFANIETLLSQSTMTVNGTIFTYNSYAGSTRRATFTGSVAVNNGDTGAITLSCTSCGDDLYTVSGTAQTADGWLAIHPILATRQADD